ncbi:response regulator [Candidatus Latescibacterota bacterium]
MNNQIKIINNKIKTGEIIMPKYTVLITEDNPKNRKVFKDILSVHGYISIEAVDGEEGYKMAKEHKPDLIVMDVQLPRADGYEVTRRLKSEDDTKDIPIIIVTSFAMAVEENEARAAGCNDYLTKPINIHQFIEMIKKYLPDQGLTS